MAFTKYLIATVAAFLAVEVTSEQCSASGANQPAEDKVWTIQVTHDWGPQGYIDEAGHLQGFTLDLITEVCSAARMKCRTIWDPSVNCWNSQAGQHAVGGTGLMAGYYDACVGWTGTVGRMQVFDFSMPFFAVAKIYFYKKKGSSFDPKDVTGKKIGFRDGWFSDEKCLARQGGIKGVPIDTDNVKYFASTDALVTALDDGSVDAVFVIDHSLFSDKIEKVEEMSMSCSSAGDGMMTRKDTEFNQHWNRGFQQIQANGRFSRLCSEGTEKHGHKGDVQPCV